MATGRPCSLANATTSSAPATGSAVPGTSGAPTRCAMCRAVTLSPRSRLACGVVPIQVSPAIVLIISRRSSSRRTLISQNCLLRWGHVDDAPDDPRPGQVDAAGARVRRQARAGELAGRRVGEYRARLDLPRAAQAGRG